MSVIPLKGGIHLRGLHVGLVPSADIRRTATSKKKKKAGRLVNAAR
jgi:hypothetical protein